MPFNVGSTAAEIGVGETADHGILLNILVKISDRPGAWVFRLPNRNAKGIAGVFATGCVVLNVIAKYCEGDFPVKRRNLDSEFAKNVDQVEVFLKGAGNKRIFRVAEEVNSQPLI